MVFASAEWLYPRVWFRPSAVLFVALCLTEGLHAQGLPAQGLLAAQASGFAAAVSPAPAVAESSATPDRVAASLDASGYRLSPDQAGTTARSFTGPTAGLSAELGAPPTSPQPPSQPAPPVAPSPETTTPNALFGTVVSREAWQPLTGRERGKIYLLQTYATPGVFLRAFGAAASDQSDNRPREWGQGAGPYFQRVGNRFARFTLQDTLEAGGSALLHHEVRYIRCSCTGFLPRFGHALAMNFVTLNDKGHWVPHVSRVGAAFAAEFIGNSWMPDDYRTRSEAFQGVAVQLGFGSLFNVVREFSPEIRRSILRRK